MATLAQLNILLNIKGLPQVKSDLNEFKDGLDGVTKSAEDSAKVFEKSFKQSEKNFKGFKTDLKSSARELGQVSREIRSFSLLITGAFTAAFISARETIPRVNDALNSMTTSAKHISESLARAATPALEEFADSLKKIEKNIDVFSRANPELVNFTLKVGQAGLVIAAFGQVISGLIKTLASVIGLLTKLGIVSAAGGITGLGSAFIAAAAGATALYVILDKIKKKLNDLGIKTSIQDLATGIFNPIGFITQKASAFGASLTGPKRQSIGGSNEISLGAIHTGSFGGQKDSSSLRTDMVAIEASLKNIQQKSNMIVEDSLVLAENIRTAIGGIFVTLADGIGQSIGQAIVFGDNLLASLTNVLKSIAAEIISMLVSVIAKIIVLRALGVIGPIPASALFGGAQGFGEAAGGTSAGKSIGGFFRNLLPFADGGIVSKPTAALIGENGPEAVIPLNQMGSMGGNVTVILQGHTFLNDESSIDVLVRKMGNAMKRVSNRRTGGTTLVV